MPPAAVPPEPDDAALIARIAAGDSAAIEAFYARWFPQFARLATRLTGDATEGENHAQEAVVRVITGAATFREGARGRSWLLTVLRNVVRDYFRREDTRRAVSISEPDDVPGAIDVPDDEPTPPERALARERAAVLHLALCDLDDHLRAVILLHDYEGLSAPETALVLEITVKLVGSRLFRARKRLGEILHDRWPDLFPRSHR